jgi:hypothetical protein
MDSKPRISLVPPSDERGAPGLVKSLDSVAVLAIRSGSDGFVRAKVRVKEGEFAGREFVTAQPKTEEHYSENDYSREEIAAMKAEDEKRDRALSPLASVVAEVEGGSVHAVEPIQLVEAEPYNRFKPFLKKRS